MVRARTIPGRATAAPGPSRRSALAGGLAAVLGGPGAAAGTARAGEAAGDVPAALRAAIARHRVAWQAFQIAPEGEAGQAEDRETRALGALLGTPCGTAGGVRALAAHLGWYADEEDDNLAAEGGPYGRIVRARLADLAMALAEPVPAAAPPGPSPLLAAIVAHAAADAAASAAALRHSRALDADDPEAKALLRIADEACEADDVALTALRALRPRDLGEAAALARHYADTAAGWEPETMSEWLLDGLATALEGE